MGKGAPRRVVPHVRASSALAAHPERIETLESLAAAPKQATMPVRERVLRSLGPGRHATGGPTNCCWPGGDRCHRSGAVHPADVPRKKYLTVPGR